jgi:hypothetical protein
VILSEPTTLASDWLLAGIALAFGLRLRGAGDRRRPRRLWSAAFLTGAAAAFAGGVVHGFPASLGTAAHAVLWTAVLVATGLAASLVLGGTVLATVTGRGRAVLLAAAVVQLASFVVVIAAAPQTRHAVWNGAVAIAAIFALTLAAVGQDRPRFLWIVLGLGFSVAGLWAQRAGLTFSVMNHNDVCHGLQAASLWPFYRAGLALREAVA